MYFRFLHSFIVAYAIYRCQIKTNASKIGAFVRLLIILAGDESHASNPLIEDFILVGRRLEKLKLDSDPRWYLSCCL
jgi:hypothetical protein